MKEYAFENGKEVDVSRLEAGWLPDALYKEINAGMVRPCHDVFIEYDSGLLLVTRRNNPANGILWPIGGTLLKGVPMEESLRRRAKSECNLDLSEIAELGQARTFWATDPWNTGKGTDTISFVYYAKGTGTLKLDRLHSDPVIVVPEDYTEEFRRSLHDYVRDFMDLAMPKVGK